MTGCFSWCGGSQKVSSKVNLDLITRAGGPKKVSAVPTTQAYVLEGTSEAIKILKQAVGVVGGVPGAQEVLELALALIQTCQDLTEIEEKVSELKAHIESLMLVMVAGVTGKNMGAIPQDLIKDIGKLGTDLEAIKQDLDEIATQSRFLIALFRATNKAKVDRCMELLKNSLTHWEVARDISQGVILHGIQQGISKMQEDLITIQGSMGVLNRRAHTANHASSRQMPTKPTIFFGRDAFVTDIVNILVNTTADLKPPRICIHGPGGMGKTSIALAVMEDPQISKKFNGDDLFWVPCVCATSPDLLLQILYHNLRISLDTGDYLADIITELRSSSSPRLMLLDNFETPWDPNEGSKEDVENILNRLAALSQLSILVTMRTNIPPSEQIAWVDRPLGTVDAKNSYDIYCTIHPAAKGKPKLDELLVDLGHMPFAITLVAQLGKTSKSMPSALLKDWHKIGPGMLSSDEEGEDSISRSITLSMNSKTMVKNIPARTLLATLSMLPAGTTHSHLDLWAPQVINKRAAISALNGVALIVDTELPTNDSEASISVLPVIQSYMQQCDRIPLAVRDNVRNAAYKFVHKHKSSPGDLSFKAGLAALSTEEANIQSILLESTRDTVPVPDIEKGLEALIAFSWYQHWNKPRTEVVEYGLRIARNAQLEKYIAEFLFCLGSTFFRLDRYQDARGSYIEARDYFRKLSNNVRASECSFELAFLYIYLDQPSDSEEALLSVSEKDLGTNGYLRGRKALMYGMYYSHFPPWTSEEALEALNIAKEAFDKEEIRRPVDKADCLHSISRVLAAMGRYPEALETVDQCLDIYEKFGPESRLVDSLLVKDYILLYVEAPFSEVLQTLERTLQRAQELGGPLAIAQALELLGELHARERKVLSAIKYYKAAEVEYETISQDAQINRCQYNCSQLELMEGDPEAEWDGDKISSFLQG